MGVAYRQGREESKKKTVSWIKVASTTPQRENELSFSLFMYLPILIECLSYAKPCILRVLAVCLLYQLFQKETYSEVTVEHVE